MIAEDFVEPVRDVLKANGVSLLTHGSMFNNACSWQRSSTGLSSTFIRTAFTTPSTRRAGGVTTTRCGSSAPNFVGSRSSASSPKATCRSSSEPPSGYSPRGSECQRRRSRAISCASLPSTPVIVTAPSAVRSHSTRMECSRFKRVTTDSVAGSARLKTTRTGGRRTGRAERGRGVHHLRGVGRGEPAVERC